MLLTLPHRVLIANRGEIAVRIIATCQALGIATIAMYSDADIHALHVRQADTAVAIGGVSSAESYLRIDKVIAAARTSGAGAIHPGYGFLSENAAFAEACAEAGIVFIGPPPGAMRLLGNKVRAKEAAEEAGVPVLPDYRGAEQSPSMLLEAAARIGFPVLIKAAAGGGGRGMRVVETAEALPDALEAARREAAAAFGDGTVFLERYLPHPRHIEVQILADVHGAVIALGERECSIQRRHQKVIEEAPSPVVDPPLRAALGEAAARLARAAGYVNAGTVEFLLDADGRFYFLEMNTRIQVEHPVTELVTGLDLVAAQIRIAAGEPLSRILPALASRGDLDEALVPADTPRADGSAGYHGAVTDSFGNETEAPAPRGHAIEARLYAEDPSSGFLPAAGTISRWDMPHLPGLRIDAGVEAGDTVGVHYDPMLAKVIAYGETRAAALARLRHALARCRVSGLTTNLAYLRRILAHPRFAAGDLSTRFLDEHEADLLPRPTAPEALHWIAAALAYTLATAAHGEPGGRQATSSKENERASLWQTLGPWRHGPAERLVQLCQRDEARTVTLQRLDHDAWLTRIDEDGPRVTVEQRSGAVLVRATDGGRMVEAILGDGVEVIDGQATYRFSLAPAPEPGSPSGAAVSGGSLQAPMPGVLVKVHVREGQHVEARQPLMVLEAMKMEHVILAPTAGIVRRLPYQQSALVPAGATLVELEDG